MCIRDRYPFPRQIKFSILVPLYNTPEDFLKEMIASVQAQTYSNWELCLADGSDDEHRQVGQIVAGFQQQDGRIQYRKLERNLGISGNTNACIEMASGDYIALFDHDAVSYTHLDCVQKWLDQRGTVAGSGGSVWKIGLRCALEKSSGT